MQGYVEGQPLGNPRRSGILVPLEPNKRRDRAGLGHVGYLPNTNPPAVQTSRQGPLPYDRQWDPNRYSSFKAVYCAASKSYLYPGDDGYPDADPGSVAASVVQKPSSSGFSVVDRIGDMRDEDVAMISEPARRIDESFEGDLLQKETIVDVGCSETILAQDRSSEVEVDEDHPESVESAVRVKHSLDQTCLVGDTSKAFDIDVNKIGDMSDEDVAMISERVRRTDESFEGDSHQNETILDVGCSVTTKAKEQPLDDDDRRSHVEVDEESVQPPVLVKHSLDETCQADDTAKAFDINPPRQTDECEAGSEQNESILDSETRPANDQPLAKKNETFSEVEVDANTRGNVNHNQDWVGRAVVVETSLDQSFGVDTSEEDSARFQIVSERTRQLVSSCQAESRQIEPTETTPANDQPTTNDDKNDSFSEVQNASAQDNVDHTQKSVAEDVPTRQVNPEQESVEETAFVIDPFVLENRGNVAAQFGTIHVTNEPDGKCATNPSPETTFGPAICNGERATRNTW